jgi:hypothetical protein
MPQSPFFRSIAAAALLFAVACDKTSDPLSSNGDPSFESLGSEGNQRVEGHASTLGGYLDYTFTAQQKKGVLSGQVDVTIRQYGSSQADIVCMQVVPGTTHARFVAIVTQTTNPFVQVGEYWNWTVTDGGHGANALPDGASTIYYAPLDPMLGCVIDPEEEHNDQIDVRVKP